MLLGYVAKVRRLGGRRGGMRTEEEEEEEEEEDQYFNNKITGTYRIYPVC
jgi:hypothetical protein